MLDRLSAGVCVLSVASRPHWRGLRRFFRALSEQREGAGRQRTTPSEPRADRGSDSTFQMADIARRILARGSTSPPVCKTADCFLFLFLSFSLSLSVSVPSPVFFLPQPLPLSSNSKQKNTDFHTQVGCRADPSVSFLFFYHLNLHTFPVHTAFTPLFLSFCHPPLNFPSTPAHSFPFSKKKAASIWL